MDFLEGFLTGLGMIIFVGPVFFLLLTTALEFGTKAGLAVALGIIISDITCVCLCYFGLAQFLNSETSSFYISIAGALLLIGMGISYLFKKQEKVELKTDIKIASQSAFFIKGFLVNFVNPFVFMIWLGIIEYGESHTTNGQSLSIFLAGVLCGIFFIDAGKALLSKHIQPYVTPAVLNWIYKISSLVMLGFGIRLLVYIF